MYYSSYHPFLDFFPLLSLSLLCFTFTCGLGPLPWVLSNEVNFATPWFPTHHSWSPFVDGVNLHKLWLYNSTPWILPITIMQKVVLSWVAWIGSSWCWAITKAAFSYWDIFLIQSSYCNTSTHCGVGLSEKAKCGLFGLMRIMTKKYNTPDCVEIHQSIFVGHSTVDQTIKELVFISHHHC